MNRCDDTPRVIAFLCHHCSYAGADMAGTLRRTYPANLRAIEVMCSGRVNPGHVLQAFLQGADGVLVAGCHPGDCHYEHGNLLMQRRILLLRKLLEFIGVEPERLRLVWVSATEGQKFAEVAASMTEELRALGPARCLRRRAREEAAS